MERAPRYDVIISDRARDMLGIHIRFMANVNKQAAQKVKTAILNAIRSLAIMPERFPFLNEEHIPANKYHKMFVENWYLILYQIKDGTVYVDHIIDCRQDYGWLVK